MANRPEDTLRDGPLKATIWRNEGDKGPFYSVQLIRTYTDDSGNLQNSDSFSSKDLLRVAHLATKAYDRAAELRAASREAS